MPSSVRSESRIGVDRFAAADAFEPRAQRPDRPQQERHEHQGERDAEGEQSRQDRHSDRRAAATVRSM